MSAALRERLSQAEGKWPDFPEAVLEAVRRRGGKVPGPLGPSRPEEFKPSLRDFVSRELIPKLSPAEVDRLRAAEGKWPDYPRLIQQFAAERRLKVPGMALPGPSEQWDRVRLWKPAKAAI